MRCLFEDIEKSQTTTSLLCSYMSHWLRAKGTGNSLRYPGIGQLLCQPERFINGRRSPGGSSSGVGTASLPAAGRWSSWCRQLRRLPSPEGAVHLPHLMPAVPGECSSALSPSRSRAECSRSVQERGGGFASACQSTTESRNAVSIFMTDSCDARLLRRRLSQYCLSDSGEMQS